MTPTVRTILFVCAGNICRSPMAVAAFRHIVKSRPVFAGIEVGSAGTVATHGSRATPEAIAAAQEAFGEDISAHRARNVEDLDADLILTIDRAITRSVRRMGKRGTVVMLGEFAGTHEPVSDPYGCDGETFHACAEHLRSLIEKVADRLEKDDERVKRKG